MGVYMKETANSIAAGLTARILSMSHPHENRKQANDYEKPLFATNSGFFHAKK